MNTFLSHYVGTSALSVHCSSCQHEENVNLRCWSASVWEICARFSDITHIADDTVMAPHITITSYVRRWLHFPHSSSVSLFISLYVSVGLSLSLA